MKSRFYKDGDSKEHLFTMDIPIRLEIGDFVREIITGYVYEIIDREITVIAGEQYKTINSFRGISYMVRKI